MSSALCVACGQTGTSDEDESTPASSSTTEAPAGSTGPVVPDPGTTGGGSESSSEGVGTTWDDSSTGGPAFIPGRDALVPIIENAHVFWLGWDEGQNQRELDFEVELPDKDRVYESVTLTLRLSCPNETCDWWDRKGSLGLVADPDPDNPVVWELARFVTPYRVGGTWALDITPLQSLLRGDQTLRLYIDTWVGPGHANGDGWLVDAQLEYVGGVPDLIPVEVVPLWPRRELTVGDPMNPLSEQIDPASLEIPTDAARVDLWTVITGHGQGNLDNCAEFCQLAQGFLIADAPVQQTIWRDDCDQNPVQGQQGTWTLPRAGWCPGDIVQPWVQDITAEVRRGASVEIAYDTEAYENTCRPDAPVCTGCALGTGCEYDGGNHTPPTIQVSSAAVVYVESGR